MSDGRVLPLEPDPRWERAAAREPYFSIFTSPKFLRANFTAAHEREFFETGERFVDSTLRLIEARFIPDFTPVSILEYGCGVGRLAIPFARRAGSVLAVDYSPSMLEAARGRSADAGVANIEFCAAKEFFTRDRKFDLVNCYSVFQRMPPREGLILLRRLVDRLGAGGIGVFHFAYRTATSRTVDASRWLRARVPAINGVANLLRGKPFRQVFGATYTYDLNDIIQTLREASIHSEYVVFEGSDDLSSALVLVEAPLSYTSVGAPGSADRQERLDGARRIDVNEVIAGTPIAALNVAAEEYFASLRDWEYHLGKPFSNLEETPRLLMAVGAIFQGMRLSPGATVLEYGAGTGWLSRFLTQMGCRVVLLDVSETALRIARQLYERQPVIGDRPPPQFLHFDGNRIDLAEKSVDRVLSFHAFHHAPNPDVVLRELGRILKPGGIAGFVEPGPRHSRSTMSQFEMRTYGVVENDVDVHQLWRTAQTCGFSDLKLVVSHEPPFHVSLEEYEGLLAGGPTCARWVTSTRGFLRNVRSFLMFKEGAEDVDSRSATGLACRIHAVLACAVAREGHGVPVDVTVTNSGTARWLPSSAPVGGIAIGVHLCDAAGRLLRSDYHQEALSDEGAGVAPGETVTRRLRLPPLTAGQYVLQLDCVASRVAWFAQIGSEPATLAVQVRPAADSSL